MQLPLVRVCNTLQNPRLKALNNCFQLLDLKKMTAQQAYNTEFQATASNTYLKSLLKSIYSSMRYCVQLCHPDILIDGSQDHSQENY